jgi:hypothetical protein
MPVLVVMCEPVVTVVRLPPVPAGTQTPFT